MNMQNTITDGSTRNKGISLKGVFAAAVVACVPFMTVRVAGMGGLLLFLGIPLLLLSLIDLFQNRKLEFTKEKTPIISFFVYGLCACLWTTGLSGDTFYTYIKVIVIVFCLCFNRFSLKEQRLMLIGSITTCVLICFWMLSGNSGIAFSASGRAYLSILGVEQDPNYMSFLFFFPFAASIIGFFEKKNIVVKLLCVCFAIVIMYCVLMTGSRGAWISCTAIILVYLLCKYGHSKKLIIGVVFFAIVAIYVFPALLNNLAPNIAARFSFAQLLEDRGTGRLDIWLIALAEAIQSPIILIFGNGTGSSNAVIGAATHNYFIQLLLEEGIIGVVLFSRFVLYWIKRFIKDKNYLSLSVLSASVIMSLTLSVNTNYYFWITVSLCIATKNLYSRDTIFEREGVGSMDRIKYTNCGL